jgi:uncharacterized protein involved in type VI secretion and phage assembly
MTYSLLSDAAPGTPECGRDTLRPLHGHITAVERLAADGGFARYRLALEPWTAFLRHRRDCYVCQDKSVLDIIEDIFGDYRDNGRLVPTWRFALTDAGRYKPRDAGSDSLGRHTLVIADHNGAFAPNVQDTIRFHRAAVEHSDSITAWHARRTIRPMPSRSAVGTTGRSA